MNELAHRNDTELPVGTRIAIEGFGTGSYVEFHKKRVGANEHSIRLDGVSGERGEGRLERLKLKELQWILVSQEPQTEQRQQEQELERQQQEGQGKVKAVAEVLDSSSDDEPI